MDEAQHGEHLVCLALEEVPGRQAVFAERLKQGCGDSRESLIRRYDERARGHRVLRCLAPSALKNKRLVSLVGAFGFALLVDTELTRARRGLFLQRAEFDPVQPQAVDDGFARIQHGPCRGKPSE